MGCSTSGTSKDQAAGGEYKPQLLPHRCIWGQPSYVAQRQIELCGRAHAELVRPDIDPPWLVDGLDQMMVDLRDGLKRGQDPRKVLINTLSGSSRKQARDRMLQHCPRVQRAILRKVADGARRGGPLLPTRPSNEHRSAIGTSLAEGFAQRGDDRPTLTLEAGLIYPAEFNLYFVVKAAELVGCWNLPPGSFDFTKYVALTRFSDSGANNLDKMSCDWCSIVNGVLQLVSDALLCYFDQADFDPKRLRIPPFMKDVIFWVRMTELMLPHSVLYYSAQHVELREAEASRLTDILSQKRPQLGQAEFEDCRSFIRHLVEILHQVERIETRCHLIEPCALAGGAQVVPVQAPDGDGV